MGQPVTARVLEFNEENVTRGTGDQGGQFVSQGGTGTTSRARGTLTYSGTPQTNRTTGPKKAKKLKARTSTLRRDADNDPAAVAQLQALIRELKLVDIAVDGTYGTATEAAVRAIQEKLGLNPTGTANLSLVKRLKEAHQLSPCVDRGASQVTAAAGEDEQTGAIVALVPADDDAEALAVEDGEPVDELHCTLLYLGEAADLDDDTRNAITGAVGDLAARYAPVTADGFAVSLFNPEGDEPCIVLGLSGAELTALHDAVAAVSEASPEQHQPWIPHVTLIYDADASMVADVVDRTGPVTFDRLRVAFAGEVHDYPLRGAPVAAAAGHDVTPGHDELHHYWTRGEGLAKWADSPTPWTTLVALLTKHVGPLKAKTFASRWFIEVFGFAAGSDKNRVMHGKPPRGHLVGPG